MTRKEFFEARAKADWLKSNTPTKCNPGRARMSGQRIGRIANSHQGILRAAVRRDGHEVDMESGEAIPATVSHVCHRVAR